MYRDLETDERRISVLYHARFLLIAPRKVVVNVCSEISLLS
jgi:hypothetical protein